MEDDFSATTLATRKGIRAAVIGICVNACLALVKGVAGVVGNSYALVADAIESATDTFSSLIVVAGLTLAGKPADHDHPYGHGKFEPLAALAVAIMLLGAAVIIAIASVREILVPHHSPAPFTLLVLVGVIAVKESLFRFVLGVGVEVSSTAVKTDAWHHRSDAITSAAAFVGIAIAIVGGPGYEAADDFAALLASFIIALNAALLMKPALFELTDQAPDPQIALSVRGVAESVPGVLGTHKCNVRKLGFDFFVDLDILCDPEATIRQGHNISHDVGEAVHRALPSVRKILVHVEPVDDYGRRSRDAYKG
jgi:cation diffusion facilitator family transporter